MRYDANYQEMSGKDQRKNKYDMAKDSCEMSWALQ